MPATLAPDLAYSATAVIPGPGPRSDHRDKNSNRAARRHCRGGCERHRLIRLSRQMGKPRHGGLSLLPKASQPESAGTQVSLVGVLPCQSHHPQRDTPDPFPGPQGSREPGGAGSPALPWGCVCVSSLLPRGSPDPLTGRDHRAPFAPAGGLLRGPAVQPDPAHLRAGGVPHVPAREGGGAAARALPQDRWAPPPPRLPPRPSPFRPAPQAPGPRALTWP